MPQRLDPKAAAAAIRGHLAETMDPEDRHVEMFVGKVLDELGMEHTIANASNVVRALHKHDIQPHQMIEYPKWVDHPTDKIKDRDGHDTDKPVRVLVQNEDEERALAGGDEPVHDADQPEYPKTINVRGTDGEMHPRTVHDLKEERELRGVGVSAIDPEASTQFKKAGLEEPTEEEIERAEDVSGNANAAKAKAALDQANAPKDAPRRPGGPMPRR